MKVLAEFFVVKYHYLSALSADLLLRISLYRESCYIGLCSLCVIVQSYTPCSVY